MTTKAKSEDKYQRRANLYASARPSYPDSLVDHLVSFLPRSKAVLDVGAGSGQLSLLLSKYFDRVVALDKSESQLSHAHQRENITYQTGLATKLPFLSDTKEDKEGERFFDAVTCAQVYHYFIAEGIDEQYLQEACRVLNPEHGKLGIFGYGICRITSSEPLREIFEDFYFNDLGSNLPASSPDCSWEVDRRPLDNGLEKLNTFGIMEIVDRVQEVHQKKMKISGFLNYIRTFSGLSNLQKMCAAEGKIDPMEKLHKAFEANSQDGELLTMEFPFFMVVLQPSGETR